MWVFLLWSDIANPPHYCAAHRKDTGEDYDYGGIHQEGPLS